MIVVFFQKAWAVRYYHSRKFCLIWLVESCILDAIVLKISEKFLQIQEVVFIAKCSQSLKKIQQTWRLSFIWCQTCFLISVESGFFLLNVANISSNIFKCGEMLSISRFHLLLTVQKFINYFNSYSHKG